MRINKTLYKIFFLGFFLLTLSANPSEAFATTYYVDSTTGLDSDTGLTEDLAWQTLNKVETSSFNPGDNILLKRGETWSENLVFPSSGNSDNVITIGPYGTGDKPVIDASGSLHGLDIRNGKNYITVESLVITGSTQETVFIYASASNITLNALDLSNTDRAIYISSGTFSNISISNITSSSVTKGFYAVNFTSLTNLVFDNVDFSSATNDGLLIDNATFPNISSDITISNSTFNNNTLRGVYIRNVEDITITNVTTNQNVLSGIQIANGGDNIILSDITSNLNGSMGIYFGDGLSNLALQDITLTSNTGNGLYFEGAGTTANISGASALSNKIDGFNIHGSWSNINFLDCAAENNGVDGAGADGDGFSFHDTASGTIKKSISRNNFKTAVAHVGSAVVDMENNIFSHDTNGTLALIYLTNSGTYSLYNNVIYSGGTIGSGMVLAGPTLTFKNNIIKGFNLGIEISSGTFTNDYNIVYGANTDNWSGITQGSNSLSSDPSFTNELALDFTLQVNSPAINAGTNLGLSTDYLGQTIYGIPDIGAYEYIDVNPPSVTLSPVGAVIYDNTPIFSGVATDVHNYITGVEYSIDGGVWSTAWLSATDGSFNSASEAFTITVPVGSKLADGSHTIRIRATDSLSNTSTYATSSFIVNTSLSISKIGTLTYTIAGTYYYTGLSPTFTGASEDGSTVTLMINGQGVDVTDSVGSDGSWSLSGHQFTQGSYLVTIISTNALSSTTTFTLVIDPSASLFPLEIMQLIYGTSLTQSVEANEEVVEETETATNNDGQAEEDTTSEDTNVDKEIEMESSTTDDTKDGNSILRYAWLLLLFIPLIWVGVTRK